MQKYSKTKALTYLENMAQSNAIENNPLTQEEYEHLRSMIERGLTSEQAMFEILEKYVPNRIKPIATAK